MSRREKITVAVAFIFAIVLGAAWTWPMFIVGFVGLFTCVGLLLLSAANISLLPARTKAEPEPEVPSSAVDIGNMPAPSPIQIPKSAMALVNIYREQLLLRRFQLFPVEWIYLADAQNWMGVTQSEAEQTLKQMQQRGVVEVDALGRWALTSSPRLEAIEKPVVPDLPVDAVEERKARMALESPPTDRPAFRVVGLSQQHDEERFGVVLAGPIEHFPAQGGVLVEVPEAPRK